MHGSSHLISIQIMLITEKNVEFDAVLTLNAQSLVVNVNPKPTAPDSKGRLSFV